MTLLGKSPCFTIRISLCHLNCKKNISIDSHISIKKTFLMAISFSSLVNLIFFADIRYYLPENMPLAVWKYSLMKNWFSVAILNFPYQDQKLNSRNYFYRFSFFESVKELMLKCSIFKTGSLVRIFNFLKQIFWAL